MKKYFKKLNLWCFELNLYIIFLYTIQNHFFLFVMNAYLDPKYINIEETFGVVF